MNVLVHGEGINVESAVASSNTNQPVLTLLVHGDPAKNSAITESMSSEDVIEVEGQEVEEIVAFLGLERPECPGFRSKRR